MTKKILILIPCLLLVVGLLASCGTAPSDQAAAQQLTNTTWRTNADDTTDLTGFGSIDIDLPFDLGDLITIKFNEDGKTGSISLFNSDILNIEKNFTWSVYNGKIVLRFNSLIFGKTIDLNFVLTENSLTLDGTGIDIKLARS